ncbi:MAG: hypothetical protein Q8P15_02115 [Nanoarchaeota archaeon]|nr:hypothetical protein [Nanoarchaeota archaeon]
MSLKNLVIGIAIIILTISVVVYGVSTFYEEPKYEDFCGDYRTQEIIETQERCEEIGGMWNSYGEIPKPVNGETIEGYCDRDYTCRQEYETANEKYSRNLFLITLPIGIAIIALGAIVFGLEAVGAGLMGGGVGTILWGVTGFWRFADDWLKFILSLVGLIVLIWLAYYFNRKFSGKKR